jgi:hypothetical protein
LSTPGGPPLEKGKLEARLATIEAERRSPERPAAPLAPGDAGPPVRGVDLDPDCEEVPAEDEDEDPDVPEPPPPEAPAFEALAASVAELLPVVVVADVLPPEFVIVVVVVVGDGIGSHWSTGPRASTPGLFVPYSGTVLLATTWPPAPGQLDVTTWLAAARACNT